jgi:competence protein ComEC
MKKYLLLIIFSILVLGGFLIYQHFIFNDGKLHIVFCDVGQGDAVLIKTPDNKYILVDSGPDKKVLDCLSRHMPLWQRQIDLALLSHPHADHFMGFQYVIGRYHINNFATEKLKNETPGFPLLMQKLSEKHIPQRFVLAGDRWILQSRIQNKPDVVISIAGPSQAFLDRTSPGGKIGESKEFASLIAHVTYGSFSTLLTGDSQATGVEEAYAEIEKQVTILQVPHHGSATGLTTQLMEKLVPETAVISVGKNNYGHPSLATLYLLKNLPVKRTDKEGDIEIVSDGKTWHIGK